MKAFVSYAHEDERALNRLHTHLAMLKREGLSEWHDQQLLADADLDEEIRAELESSQIFLALVSPDYLDSKYCYETELQAAIDLGLRIIPILVEPSDWETSMELMSNLVYRLHDSSGFPADRSLVNSVNKCDPGNDVGELPKAA